MKNRVLIAVLAGTCIMAGTAAMAQNAAVEKETTVKTTAEDAVEDVVEEETEVSDAAEEDEIVYETEALGERPTYNASEYVTLGEYKNLAVSVPEVTVSDDELEFEFKYDVEYAVEEKELFEKIEEGTVAEGDTANIDYVGTIDDVAFDGGSAQGSDLEIGSGTFIEGFEEQLIGVNVGDTVAINVTFPDYYYEELAGKDAVFTVTVNYIKRMPEVTDDLISQITDGEYTTVEDYREYVRGMLKENSENLQKEEIDQELMTQLFNTCEVSGYPEELILHSVTSARNYYIGMAPFYGMTFQDLLDMYGMTDEQFREELANQARESLKQEMILKAIGEAENITISEEEYAEGLQEFTDSYGYPTVEEFEQQYGRTTIEEALLMNKVMDFVRENAVITITEPETFDEDELEFFDDEIVSETEDFDYEVIDVNDGDMEEEFDVVFDEEETE